MLLPIVTESLVLADNNVTKKVLILCRNAPYGTSTSREAIDVALAGAVFEQNISILFLDDGVYQLLNDQQSDAIMQKNQTKLLDSLEMYDIEQLYAEYDSLENRGLHAENIHSATTILDSTETSAFISSHQVILSY